MNSEDLHPIRLVGSAKAWVRKWLLMKLGGSADMNAPVEIQDLVKKYRDNIAEYRSSKFKETSLRVDFLDPLFESLGWDIRNAAGKSILDREVILEYSQEADDTVRAPDYLFRNGSRKMFYMEAKRPQEKLLSSRKSAFQIRRYSWNSNLAVGVLSNFEYLSLYVCLDTPSSDDAADFARIRKYGYEDFLTKWDEIVSLLSKPAVNSGSLAKLIGNKSVRPEETVDARFLDYLRNCRTKLAEDVQNNNKELSAEKVRYAVNRLINRLVFLRIAEDRGIEKQEQLLSCCKGKNTYGRLFDLFYRIERTYNSGLFCFPTKGRTTKPFEDRITPKLNPTESLLNDLITQLYFPRCVFNFAAMPSEVLGSAYESFLGEIIVSKDGGGLKIEEKPEVKKAGGVFYTPRHIVDYIVSETLAKALDGKTPNAITEFRVLDMACGSGSFLIGAYDCLLRWYLKYYIEKSRKTSIKKKYIYEREGDFVLTTNEKKRILMRHIFGVDIDTEAVEITKLSLLLQVIEGEDSDTIGSQMALIESQVLPDLSRNVRAGNSIVETDLFSAQDGYEEPTEYWKRINPFEWTTAFPEVFSAEVPGFEVVIGNPPYIDSEWMSKYHFEEREYCKGKYSSASGNWDIFCVFVERAVQMCKEGGYFSYIVPNKLAGESYAGSARRIVTSSSVLTAFRDYSSVDVFPVAVYPVVFVCKKDIPVSDDYSIKFEKMANGPDLPVSEVSRELSFSNYFGAELEPWAIFGDLDDPDMINQIDAVGVRLRDVAAIHDGASVNESYRILEIVEEAATEDVSAYFRLVNSGNIDAYTDLWQRKKVKYIKNSFVRPVVSRAALFDLLPKRHATASTPKLIVANMTKDLECTIDLNGEILAGKSSYTIVPVNYSQKLILAIINSSLINFWFLSKYASSKMSGGYLATGAKRLGNIPIPRIASVNVSSLNMIERLVDERLDLESKWRVESLPDRRQSLLDRVAENERRIDGAIFSLYTISADQYDRTLELRTRRF